MSTKTATNYLAESIDWKRTADPRHPFAAKFEGEKCVIRLNDFPDEHLYTLIVDGEEVVAFDDWSASWNRPAKEKSVSQPAPNKSLARTGKRSAKTSPWHSIEQSVYHDSSGCNTGNNIDPEHLQQGTGGKPLCQECSLLDQIGR